MKKILKKNQVIITALAIMIVIAGYLSFTKEDGEKDGKYTLGIGTDKNDDLMAEDPLSILDGANILRNEDDGTDNDDGNDNNANDNNDANNDINNDGINDNTEKDNTVGEETDDLDKNKIDETNVGELGNNSVEDEKNPPGEAVLATAIDSGYFFASKLGREQTRAQAKATYMEIIDNDNVSEADKQKAVVSMINIAAIAEKENAAELLLEAKGFQGAIVSMTEEKVDVIINAPNITNQQVVIIEDVIKRKTDTKVENIAITPVVAQE